MMAYQQYNFNSVNLVKYIWSKRLPLIIVSVAAFILSAVGSLFIEDKFVSEVVLFPTAENSISQDLLVNGGRKDLLKLGKDEEVEQYLQILQSQEITMRIIEKYDLLSHYKIDPTKDKYPYTTLGKIYKGNVEFKPTKFMSIVVSVRDTDPQMAANIANDIAELADTVMTQIIRQKAKEACRLVEIEYEAIHSEIRVLEDSLDYIRSLGVIDYELQTERFTEALGNAYIKGNNTAVRQIQSKLDILAKHGGAYLAIRDDLEILRTKQNFYKTKRSEAILDATESLPKAYILNYAGAAEKKEYPKRSIIVLAATFASFLLMLLFFVISDSIKEEE